eukprot:TRINITY_DN8003_c0_g1_i1.p1 TRINITY_DN8003_c0_g1~~TRINITY_DN8003_c0_g1_i1.p1  ORF type:complete len:447 (-),score=183.70 TRINITY_DN8003_c0_g1_i1:27-1367(-)
MQGVARLIMLAALTLVALGSAVWFLQENQRMEKEIQDFEDKWAKEQHEWSASYNRQLEKKDKLEFLHGSTIFNRSRINERPYSPNGEKHAIVTAFGGLSDVPQWLGVVTLARSLREVHTRVPDIIALDYSNSDAVPELAHTILKELGVQVFSIDTSFLQKLGFHVNRAFLDWGQVWSRLLLFELTEYDRVLFLDYSAIVTDNIDHLLMWDDKAELQKSKDLSNPFTNNNNNENNNNQDSANAVPKRVLGAGTAPSPSPTPSPSQVHNHADHADQADHEVAVDLKKLIWAGPANLEGPGNPVERGCQSCGNDLDMSKPSANMFLVRPSSSVSHLASDYISKYFTEQLAIVEENDPEKVPVPRLSSILSHFGFTTHLLPSYTHTHWGLCGCSPTLKSVYTRGCTYMEDPWLDTMGRPFVDPECVGDLFVLWLQLFTHSVPESEATILR